MDIKLYFLQSGEGFPLVLLHGNGGCSDYFENQINEFSKSYRVITPDTRGHGKSPRGEAPFSLEQFAEDLKEFLDEQRIKRCFLLGFSDGGNIALLFSINYPQYIEKLILNGANLNPKGVKKSVQTPIIIGWQMLKFIKRFDKKAINKWEMLNLMVTQPKIDSQKLKNLKMPVLVIAGTNDMILDSHTRTIAKAIPDSRLEIISGSHFIAHDRSEDFNRIVSDFLSQN